MPLFFIVAFNLIIPRDDCRWKAVIEYKCLIARSGPCPLMMATISLLFLMFMLMSFFCTVLGQDSQESSPPFHLLGLLGPVALAEPHARAVPVPVDEFDTGKLKGFADRLSRPVLLNRLEMETLQMQTFRNN